MSDPSARFQRAASPQAPPAPPHRPFVRRAVANTDDYPVERAAAGSNAFQSVATVATPGHTDTVDTSQAWTYRVTARNAAGEAAATVVSAVYTTPVPLPDGDVITFDFGPGQLADGALPAPCPGRTRRCRRRPPGRSAPAASTTPVPRSTACGRCRRWR